MLRYSRTPFPAYAYQPGKNPHPTRDPGGHSYGSEPHSPCAALEPQRWFECEDYLLGVDLFNHAYWWEAHEAWEGPWRAVGRDSLTGMYLQGLIQISVARLKWAQDLPRPAHRLSADGRRKLALLGQTYAGLDVNRFTRSVARFFSGASLGEELFIELHRSARYGVE